MSAALRSGFAAIAFAALTCAAPLAHAATWAETFASDTTRTGFLGSDGVLFRAPFNLASRQDIWTPRDDHVVRVLVSPGGRLAFFTRAHDTDTTRVWVSDDGGSHMRARYFAPLPTRFNVLRYETDRPTIDDPSIRGARLLQSNALMRRQAATPVAWTPDQRGVVFGYGEGLAVASLDSGRAAQVNEALVVGLRELEPAPIYLAEAVVLRRGAAEAGRYLIYPAPGRWRTFDAGSFSFNNPWTASEGTVWWGASKDLMAVQAHDPTLRVVLENADPILWVEYEHRHRAVHVATERRVVRVPEGEGKPVELFAPAGEITAVIGTRGGTRRGVVAGDSLVIWTLATDERRTLALGGIEPRGLHEAADGSLWVTGVRARGSTTVLARFDPAAGALVDLEGPTIKNGRIVATPARDRFVLWSPESKPPPMLHVYDIATAKWSEVENPGIVAWEPLAP